MKTIFYRHLLEASPYCGFTPTQQIIYSFLVSKSVTSNTDLFESDGQTIRTDDLIEYYQEDGLCTLDLVEMKSSFVSSTLCITPKTYFSTLSFLKGCGLIDQGTIRFTPDMIKRGYFELLTVHKLPKQILIFYSWLFNIAKNNNWAIFANSKVMAEKMNISHCTIRSMIKYLSDRGLVKRDINNDGTFGKLSIFPF